MSGVSGFTIVRNAIRLDFPLEASIRSILPVCDEVIVNVGRSEDATLDLVKSIDDPRIRILETEWDTGLGAAMLAQETWRAMRACRHPWGIYIQADEVLHERGAELVAEAIRRWDGDARVEGLLVHYLHFYGTVDTIARNRRWYRREVRAVRLDSALDVRPYGDAQGFRVGPGHRKIRARLTGAEMFHYGWARRAQALSRKRVEDSRIYHGTEAEERDLPPLEWFPGLRPYAGGHPAAAAGWVAAHAADGHRPIAPRRFRPEHLRFYLSNIVERLTGERIFEFRNYKLV